jgi:hypothetical protein
MELQSEGFATEKIILLKITMVLAFGTLSQAPADESRYRRAPTKLMPASTRILPCTAHQEATAMQQIGRAFKKTIMMHPGAHQILEPVLFS